jgi:enoyl-CoA hydratase/carnithine racemase
VDPQAVSADASPVRLERDDGVLTVTLDRRQRRNAIDGEMQDAVRDAFEQAAVDASVRAVILTGAGSAFSAGGDLSRFERDWDPREFRHDSHRLTQVVSAVERLEKPVVAAINGLATGAGTQLALACDVRIAAESARFVYREGRLGIIPSHGGCVRLVKLIGLARARDVVLGSEELTAAEAHRLGLVSEVVPDGETVDAARERIALMLKRSPQAYAAAKRLLWLGANVDLESGMVAEGLAQSLLVGTEEHKEGVRAARARTSSQQRGG